MVLGQPRAVSTFPRHPASPQPLAAASLRSPSLPSKLPGHKQSSETLNVVKHVHAQQKAAPACGTGRKARWPARRLPQAGSVQMDSCWLQKDLCSLN